MKVKVCTISRVERGHNASLALLGRLAKEFNVDVSELFAPDETHREALMERLTGSLGNYDERYIRLVLRTAKHLRSIIDDRDEE